MIKNVTKNLVRNYRKIISNPNKRELLLWDMDDSEVESIIASITIGFLWVKTNGERQASLKDLSKKELDFILKVVDSIKKRFFFNHQALFLYQEKLKDLWLVGDEWGQLSTLQLGFYYGLFDIRSPLGNKLVGQGNKDMTLWKSFPDSIKPNEL